MISRNSLIAVLMLISTAAFTQTAPSSSTDPATIPASRQQQQDDFNSGAYPYPAKPRNQWNVGINLGLPQIMGDIRSEPFGGQHSPSWGAGINIRKGLGYVTSIRLHGMYANCYGQNYTQGAFNLNKTLNGAFANSTNENYSTGADYSGAEWVPNYKTMIGHGSLDLLVNLNNINFHKADPKFLVYAFVGVGGFIYNTKYDALDASGEEYLWSQILSQFGAQNVSQQERLDAIHNALDGDYETQAEVANPQSRGAEEVRSTWVRNPSLSGGLGASWRVGSNLEIGIEQRATHFFDDLADGQRWSDIGDVSDHYDLFEYTNLTIGIDLGKNSIDPLWTVNPLDYLYQTVAEIDPDNLLRDSDNDGVIDRLDKEPNTAEGTPVDTHGVSLDSDKDGCPDSEDPEPFSSPVLPMENCQNVHLTMGEVKEYVESRLKEYQKGGSGGGDAWYLPMIFFDLNKSDIRPDAVPELEYVAEIMNNYSKLSIEVVGHTDTRASEDYNLKLSENRAKSAINYLTKKGVPESRLKIVYKGESQVLIPNATTEEQHQQNRRVEFHIIKN